MNPVESINYFIEVFLFNYIIASAQDVLSVS